MPKKKRPVAGTAHRKERKPRGFGHERREEILKAAKRLFLRHGYESVTTRQLAEQAGLSQTGLYVYFRNKEEILEELRRSTYLGLAARIRAVGERSDAVLRTAIGERSDAVLQTAIGERSDAVLQTATAQRSPDIAYLQRLLTGYLEFALENPDEYQLTFQVTHASLKQSGKKSLEGSGEQGAGMQLFTLFRDELKFLIDAGALAPADVNVVTQSLWGALHGLAILLITQPSFPWSDHSRLIDTLAATLARGLQPLPR